MSEQHGHFIVPVKFYVATFVALLILTFLTVLVSSFDFGSLNLAVALFIALIKASLVLLVFMGLKWDKGFSWVFVLGSIVCVVIFFLITFADVAYRGTVDHEEKGVHGLQTPVKMIDPNSSSHSPTHH